MTFRKLKTTNVSCLLMQTTQIGIEQKQKQLSLKYQQTHFTIFKTKDKNKPCNFAMKLKSTRKLLKKSTQYKVFGINNRQRTILEPYNILNNWKQKYKKMSGIMIRARHYISFTKFYTAQITRLSIHIDILSHSLCKYLLKESYMYLQNSKENCKNYDIL